MRLVCSSSFTIRMQVLTTAPASPQVRVHDASGLLELVHQAGRVRATGATSANETSSRSHAILRITIREPIPNCLLNWPVVGMV